MRKNIKTLYISLFCFSFLVFEVVAEIKLPSVFSSNMVLQQQTETPLWGEAKPKKNVRIVTSWDNKEYKTTADQTGMWKITLTTPSYGGPYSITLTDGKTIVLKNVMIGEVWLCSGQSNMEMPVAGWGQVRNYESEIKNASYPNIRLLQVVKTTSHKPENDVDVNMGGWVQCSPLTISNFSAAAYFFGRDLNKNLNVPIGLIQSAWGGTNAETWTSSASLKLLPDFVEKVKEIEVTPNYVEERKALYQNELAAWKFKVLSLDKGYENGKPIWNTSANTDLSWKLMQIPGIWEEQGLPNFDGVIWFKKTLEIPDSWENKDLKLNLGTIDDNDITYFNGQEVGRTEGWTLSRTYKIPAKLVKKGKAFIVVRVQDNTGQGGFYGNAANLKLEEVNGETITLDGKWNYNIGLKSTDIPREPNGAENPNDPTVLYNAMIHPLIKYSIKGAIWYQGESNADRAYQYRELFPQLINDWRKQNGTNFPFYFVQLANFSGTKNVPMESAWAELREAQLKTLNLENTGMAVIIDKGDRYDIHPKDKQEVGRRLALAARALTYHEKIEYSGPVYDSYKIEGNTIRIKFHHADGGLKTSDSKNLTGFAIAGLDHKFQWANARIDNDEVIVSNVDIENPIAVRYAWADNPVCNLTNISELPASPFRTDDWQGNTFGKK